MEPLWFVVCRRDPQEKGQPGARILELAVALGRGVRRQGFWHQWGLKLRQRMAHLVRFIMRRVSSVSIAAIPAAAEWLCRGQSRRRRVRRC